MAGGDPIGIKSAALHLVIKSTYFRFSKVSDHALTSLGGSQFSIDHSLQGPFLGRRQKFIIYMFGYLNVSRIAEHLLR